MTSVLTNWIRVVLLTAYVPVAVAIGLMHSDDMPVTGDGHHRVTGSHSQSLQDIAPHGACLACQFTAGHIAAGDDRIPVIAAET